MDKNENLDNLQYKEALLKYAHNYIQKKRKGKGNIDTDEIPRKYVIYARKSTEDDKRQVQSISDQIEQCKKFAKSNGLEVVDIIHEEKSAKIAGKRDVFDSMLKTLYEGDFYNGVIAWHPDRLSRNMKESGEILDMLDNDYILDLKFPSYAFNNDAAGKMTLSILFAMAKEFSDKLSEDTKRGNRKKVSDGKHMGNDKRGYVKGKEDYFRPHPDTYDIYKKAWKKYMQVNNQAEVAKWLNKQDEDVTVNMVSEFFRDPFSAGIYTYGEQVVDLTQVDPKFKPLVSAKDFISMQRMNRDNPRGWNITDEFRPFRDFVICADCENPMTSGLSTGKSGTQYLNVTCGNKHCKAKRKKAGKKPIANTIRGQKIIDFTKEAIIKLKEVDKKTYEKVKKKHFEDRNGVIKQINEDIKIFKGKKSKLETKEKNARDSLYEATDDTIKQNITRDLKMLNKEIKSIQEDIDTLEETKSGLEFKMEADFPPYEDFMNFFENAELVMNESDNAYLIDQIVKLVFMNTVVKDKNISLYYLNEPFDGFEKLKILNGVGYGKRLELDLWHTILTYRYKLPCYFTQNSLFNLTPRNVLTNRFTLCLVTIAF